MNLTFLQHLWWVSSNMLQYCSLIFPFTILFFEFSVYNTVLWISRLQNCSLNFPFTILFFEFPVYNTVLWISRLQHCSLNFPFWISRLQYCSLNFPFTILLFEFPVYNTVLWTSRLQYYSGWDNKKDLRICCLTKYVHALDKQIDIMMKRDNSGDTFQHRKEWRPFDIWRPITPIKIKI